MEYLKHGLVKAPSLNLEDKKFETKTCPEFIEFANDYFEFNKWCDKRDYQECFESFFPEVQLSAHLFKKWMNEFCKENNAELHIKSTGGKYLFNMKKM